MEKIFKKFLNVIKFDNFRIKKDSIKSLSEVDFIILNHKNVLALIYIYEEIKRNIRITLN